MKKTREIDASALYDADSDFEHSVYGLAVVMFACGMDGTNPESAVIDDVVLALNEHYYPNTPIVTGPEGYPSASALALGRTRWGLLKRLRLSYWQMQLAREINLHG